MGILLFVTLFYIGMQDVAIYWSIGCVQWTKPQKQYLVDGALIVGYVEHSVHDEALKCFKETFIELLVWDIIVWTTLIFGYAKHDYQLEM